MRNPGEKLAKMSDVGSEAANCFVRFMARRELLVLVGAVGAACIQGQRCQISASSKNGTKGGRLGIVTKNRIKVAQVKVVPEKGQLESNYRSLMDILGEIAREPNLDVVVTPEGFLDGYISTEESVSPKDVVQRYAIDLKTSPYVRAVAESARSHRFWFILGCTRLENACAYNTAAIINRDGHLVATYDKLHLQQHDHKYTPGGHLSVYESDFGRFGVMICADRRWPETVRTLALKGARVIFNPTYGMHNDLNLAMMRTRALESELFIIFTHPKQSLITDPKGKVVTNDENPQHRYTVTEIDLSEVDAQRNSPSGHLKDRRPGVYLP